MIAHSPSTPAPTERCWRIIAKSFTGGGIYQAHVAGHLDEAVALDAACAHFTDICLLRHFDIVSIRRGRRRPRRKASA